MNSPRPAATDWRVPTRLTAAWFALRVAVQVLRRAWHNLQTPVPRHRNGNPALADAPVLAEQSSPLWADGRPEEFILVAGKVHNLRLACRHFDAVVVPAGQVLSFWRQLGRASTGAGYVQGREVREGCVVPTVAGGLCQLSNALLRCALQAGLPVVERHRHTRQIEGRSDAPAQDDATVFWNYVDLRVRAPFDVRIEAELRADALIVRLRGLQEAVRPTTPARTRPAMTIALQPMPPPVARGCLTCDETACFRHRGAPQAVQAASAVLVDEWTPEFALHLAAQTPAAHWFLPWRPGARAAWSVPPAQVAYVAHAASLWRSVRSRLHGAGRADDPRHGGARQAAVLQGRAALAQAYAQRLRPEHRHLVIEQGLLAPLYQLGALGGREVTVLARELPMASVQAALDRAHASLPQAASLVDFRCASALLQAETRALQAAAHLVTPHAAVAALARQRGGSRVTQLAWALPAARAARRRQREQGAGPIVAFPASALARKGADDLAAVLRELQWPLLVLRADAHDASVWHGVQLLRGDVAWLDRVDVVALPAYVEHAPREVLRALAHGLPAVVSTACGLAGMGGAIEIEAGDRQGLRRALLQACSGD